MKKLTLILALSSISVAAMAQMTPKTSGFTLRAGYSYIADKASRDAVSNSGFIIGIGYDLQNMKGMSNGNTKVSIDVDYDYHSGNGNRATNWSGQLVGRFPFSQTAGKGANFYGGLGIGIFRTEAGATGAMDSKTTIGGSVIVGAALSEQLSLEACYRIVSSINGYKPSTLNFSVGFRF